MKLYDIRILIGASGHGYGEEHCDCKQCQDGNGIGGKYAINILHSDGTFNHGTYTHTEDSRVKMGETKMRVKNGPWAEKVIYNRNGMLSLQPLTISEARLEIKRWNKTRNQNKFNSSKNLLDLSRILKAFKSKDYDTLNKRWKTGLVSKPRLFKVFYEEQS